MADSHRNAYPGILRDRPAIPPPDCGRPLRRQSRPVPSRCDYACVAYDEGLAVRLLDIVGEEAGLAQKKMFGGLAVLVGGNMAVGGVRG
jgi:hypothetical protein